MTKQPGKILKAWESETETREERSEGTSESRTIVRWYIQELLDACFPNPFLKKEDKNACYAKKNNT